MTLRASDSARVRWVRCRALAPFRLAGRWHYRGDRLALVAAEAAFIRRHNLAPVRVEALYHREPGDRE